MNPLFFVVLSYLLGAVPTSFWMGKAIYGVDLRHKGSGNLGATNVLRVIGWKAALPVALVDVAKGDMNVQAPALLRTAGGDLLLISLRAHSKGNSSTMCLFRSANGGKSFSPRDSLWSRSKGQLLQGGTSSLLELKSGRLLLPYHGGAGNQWKQKNSAWCLYSDDC